MDHDDRVKRVLALVADVTAYPAHFEPLPVAERLIVALALGRVDWLNAEGVDSIVQGSAAQVITCHAGSEAGRSKEPQRADCQRRRDL